MFRCHFCQEITPPKTTRHNVVIEVREKRYASQKREFKRGGRRDFRDRDEPTPDRGGQGVEIMREVSSCPTCAVKQHDVKRFELETVAPAPDAAETQNSEEHS